MTTSIPILDRDLSWIYFNHRILQEAKRDNVPLLERLTFLGIYSNNLDEFFRVRFPVLKRLVGEADELSPKEQTEAQKSFKRINKLTKTYALEFEETFREIRAHLLAEQIELIDEMQLNTEQANYLRMVYRNDLNSATYPLIITQGAKINELTDSNIYLAVRLIRQNPKNDKLERDYALIALPTSEFGRFIQLPKQGERTFLMFLDDAVRFCLPFIFAGLGYKSFEAYTVKFTRDAEIELDSIVQEGLIDKVARGIKSRKKGETVRFVYDERMPVDMLKQLKHRLNLDQYDTAIGGSRYHNMKDLMDFPACGRPDLHFEKQLPIPLPDFDPFTSTLEMIRKRDFCLHYPYNSFSNYIRVLREAALSREVRSIKTTIYRLAKNSQVVRALICAAQHGKKVTAVVELMARFDEESNIKWAKKMQDAGINVIFGTEGLKTHCKLTHIASSKGDIACISTGNFHEGNAKLYTDITVMTAHKGITNEVDQLFTYIKQPFKRLIFKELIVSPAQMRRKLYTLINREIEQAKLGLPAYIECKINHITDEKLIAKLYEASEAGVEMRFLVRGNCSIVTDVRGVSEQIEIRGIIDRYLEHSRILIFCNGGDPLYYIGSADWMTRNIDHRIEAYVPIYDPHIQEQLRQIIQFGLADNVSARVVDGSGNNHIYNNGKAPFRSQEQLYEAYLTKK